MAPRCCKSIFLLQCLPLPHVHHWQELSFSFVSYVLEAEELAGNRIRYTRETQCLLRILVHQNTADSPYLNGKFWNFTSDLANGDTAYTYLALGAHTDNTYFMS